MCSRCRSNGFRLGCYALRVAAVGLLLPMLVACEERAPIILPAGSPAGVRTSDLSAGLAPPDREQNPFVSKTDQSNALRDGRLLYTAMNCAGCHGAKGGGGIGPPLSDTQWIYGQQLENIVQSVLQGRPAGMPTYATKLPQADVWKIAVFVQSLAAPQPEHQ